MQTARCLKAFELYKNGMVNKPVVTGGFTRDHVSEARIPRNSRSGKALAVDVAPAEDAADETRRRAARWSARRRARDMAPIAC
jgi:hypothetical protein